MRDIKADIYRRIIVLLVLRQDMKKELMQGTFRLGVRLLLSEAGVSPEVATDISHLLAPLILEEVTLERSLLRDTCRRAGIKGEGCDKPACAACRLAKWADEEPTEKENLDVGLERKIREALSKLDPDSGPAN